MFLIWFLLTMAIGLIAVFFFGYWRTGFSVMPVKNFKTKVGEVSCLGLCVVFIVLAMLCANEAAKSWLAFIGVQ